MREPLDRAGAVELVHGLVAIPSLSGEESAAASWLVERMAALGLERARVDEVGNAVAELGDPACPRIVVLLGHIDTVPGDIPVRVESAEESASGRGPILHGRGAVDAKGPLACFVAAAARLGSDWARERDLRLIVAGAVEEEAATSKGARFLADSIPGEAGAPPIACVIGEPSQAHRITLGYKGRLLIDLDAIQPSAHTAGPDPGVATVAIDFWNQLAGIAAAFNGDRPRPFDQLQVSVRSIETRSDGLSDSVRATFGLRLPVGFDAAGLREALVGSARQRLGLAGAEDGAAPDREPDAELVLENDGRRLTLRFRGYEDAHRSDKNSPLVRAFLRAIREHAPASQRAGFVVKTGTSDMNVVAPLWGSPIVAYGPGDSALDHTPEEHLELDEYWQAVLTLERALRELSRLPTPSSLDGDSTPSTRGS